MPALDGVERDAGRVAALRAGARSRRRPARPRSAAGRRRRRGTCRRHRAARLRPSATSTRASLPTVVVLPVPLTPTTSTTAGRAVAARRASERSSAGSTSASSSSRSSARAASGSATPSTLTRLRSRSTSSWVGPTPRSAVQQRLLDLVPRVLVEPVAGEQRQQALAERGVASGPAGRAAGPAGRRSAPGARPPAPARRPRRARPPAGRPASVGRRAAPAGRTARPPRGRVRRRRRRPPPARARRRRSARCESTRHPRAAAVTSSQTSRPLTVRRGPGRGARRHDDDCGRLRPASVEDAAGSAHGVHDRSGQDDLLDSRCRAWPELSCGSDADSRPARQLSRQPHQSGRHRRSPRLAPALARSPLTGATADGYGGRPGRRAAR